MARSPAHAIVSTLLVLCLLVGVGSAWLADLVKPGRIPSLSLVGLVAVTPLAFAGALAFVHRRRWQLIAVGVVTAAVLLYGWLPLHPRKVFVHDLYSVETGMTVDEVEAIMGKYIKGWGARFHPGVVDYEPPDYPASPERDSVSGTMTYRWSDGAFDADWGQVRFSNGHVVEVEFLPD